MRLLNVKGKRLRGKNHIVRQRFTVGFWRWAAWVDVPISDPNLVSYITDAMSYGETIQINYEGSGWRNIFPYGWKTSKKNALLLMCYKDDGSVRSYRMDRVIDAKIDNDTTSGQWLSTPDGNIVTPDIVPIPSSASTEQPFAAQLDALTEPNNEVATSTEEQNMQPVEETPMVNQPEPTPAPEAPEQEAPEQEQKPSRVKNWLKRLNPWHKQGTSRLRRRYNIIGDGR